MNTLDEQLDELNATLRLLNLWTRQNYSANLSTNTFCEALPPSVSFTNQVGGHYSYSIVSFDDEGLGVWWAQIFSSYGQYIDREVFSFLKGSWLEDTVTALLVGLYAASQPNVKSMPAPSRFVALRRLREVY